MLSLPVATTIHHKPWCSCPTRPECRQHTPLIDRVGVSLDDNDDSKSKSSFHHPAATCRRRRRRKSSRSALLLFFFALLILAVYLLDLSAGHGGAPRLRGGGGGGSAAARSAALQAGISGDDVFLIDLDGGEATLAAHRHDLSFAGFANRSSHWHVFRGDEGAIPNACRRLPFRNAYRDLIGGGIEHLPGLPLGRAAAAEATEALASYDADAAGEEEATAALKRGVAALSVMLVEAMRLEPIRETVSSGWESGDGEARVAAEHLTSSTGTPCRSRSSAAFFLYFLLDLGGYRSDVLSVSDLEPPSDGLFVVGLTGGLDADELAAGHDLSLAGFANRTRHWHAFRGREGLVPSAASVLPFGGDT
uniref:rRNA N-glycosylase n=1 Tax=Oryza meridionalis TaxID=40149 RepID=A0A0E0D4R1_9ORYZ